jgi:hypothetical protein
MYQRTDNMACLIPFSFPNFLLNFEVFARLTIIQTMHGWRCTVKHFQASYFIDAGVPIRLFIQSLPLRLYGPDFCPVFILKITTPPSL